jgi:glutamyl-tRNA synthetase
MERQVRVRFAPSPTGGLHLGGVRTVLYNYLFAKRNNGQFILRIEDTDQARYVEGAEQYIIDCLKWCGLEPDEGPSYGGAFGPYRQSERKDIYAQYAKKLVEAGHAYYAFDTPEELEKMRDEFRTAENPSPQYNATVRMRMKNSLTLRQTEVNNMVVSNMPYVVRILMPENEDLSFTDMIRGEVHFNSSQSDDKVLLKADGMPTYHLAVVVDDYLMKITHAFRGEEWLPSAPVHLLLWKYLGWSDQMPQFAHLPLILKPDGNGKLSKRDGDRLGFPVFAMDWHDPRTGETTKGFKELGFLPEAFVNMLAMLGWNDGTGKELFSIDQLTDAFSLERVHKSGAKFDFEKAKWFNHEWIKKKDSEELLPYLLHELERNNVKADKGKVMKIVALIKERCTLLPDLWTNSQFFFVSPQSFDLDAIKPKWDDTKKSFFDTFNETLPQIRSWDSASIETHFKTLTQVVKLKPGELLLPLRIMLVGAKYGPGVFDIAEILGVEETKSRIEKVLRLLTKS